MDRESSSRTKDLLFLVLKARHLEALLYRLKVPEQALGGIPLGFGIVIEDKPSELLQFDLHTHTLH